MKRKQMNTLLKLTRSTDSFGKKDDTDDTLKTVAKNITEYRNLGELDLDWNAIMETVDGNGNPTSSSTLYESFEEKSSVFPQNLWIKVQQTKAQAASKKM